MRRTFAKSSRLLKSRGWKAVVIVASPGRAGGGRSLLTRLLCNHQLPASNHDLNVKCALEHVCGVKTITRPLQKDGRLRSCPGLVSPASRCSLPALTTFTSVIITRLATAITILSPRLPVTLQFFPFVIKNKPEPERRKALAEDMKPWMMQG